MRINRQAPGETVQNGEWEQTCFRCYVTAESLDVEDVGNRLADALLDAGFNQDGTVGAFIAVVPEKVPVRVERLPRFLKRLRAARVVLPAAPTEGGDDGH